MRRDTSIKTLISRNIRAVNQRGVRGLNADYPFLMSKKKVFGQLCDELFKLIGDVRVDYVAGIEALGFPVAGALAWKLHAGFLAIRKEKKLPGKVIKSELFMVQYKSEKTRLEIQKDIPLAKKKIVLFDEGIDTGETLKQAVCLLKKVNCKVLFVLTLTNYPDLKEIEGVEVKSLIFGSY